LLQDRDQGRGLSELDNETLGLKMGAVEIPEHMSNVGLFYAFFWVIPRRPNFICRRFGTLCLAVSEHSVWQQTECSETSAYKIQTPGNYTEESIQHSEHGESLKSRMLG